VASFKWSIGIFGFLKIFGGVENIFGGAGRNPHKVLRNKNW